MKAHKWVTPTERPSFLEHLWVVKVNDRNNFKGAAVAAHEGIAELIVSLEPPRRPFECH